MVHRPFLVLGGFASRMIMLTWAESDIGTNAVSLKTSVEKNQIL